MEDAICSAVPQPDTAGNASEVDSDRRRSAAGYETEAISDAEHFHMEPNFLPPFANAENKQLNRHIQALEKRLEGADAGLDDINNRTAAMVQHLKGVQHELAYTQDRVTSKGREIQTEEHLNALCEREKARLQGDVRQLKRERQGLAEKVASLQMAIYRANERVDQFKILMNWNQDELEQWAVTQQQKEDDNIAIERYRAKDAAKINELSLAIERMNATVASKRATLDREVTDTQAAQVQLEKVADDFVKLHKERQGLIRQWEDATAQMRRTDAAIQSASEAFADRQAGLRELKMRLDAGAKALDDSLVVKAEREAQIEVLEREVQKLRAAEVAERSKLSAVSEQVSLSKSTLTKSGSDHAARLAEVAAVRGEIAKKRSRLDEMRRREEANKQKLESEYVHLNSLAACEAELETVRKRELARLADAERQLRELEKSQFKSGQQLHSERAREKRLISEISGAQAQSRTLAGRITQLDEQVLRQQELLYAVEFQLQVMERKVSRAKGERSEEESSLLRERIAALTTALDGTSAGHSALAAQVARARDDLAHASTSNAALLKDQARVEASMASQSVETEAVARALKSATSRKRGRLVDVDVRHLEAKQLRETLAGVVDDLYRLENRKYQVQQSMTERRHEIEVHRRSLEAQLKLLKDDLHRVTLELKGRKMRVERLEARFEVVTNKKRSLYDDGEPRSQAYHVIKAAQEREELRSKGDQLDRCVQKLQGEVDALEHTLQQMVGSNVQLRKSFQPVPHKIVNEERARLRDERDRKFDHLKFKRQRERDLAADVANAEQRARGIADERASLQRAAADGELHRARMESQEQHALLERLRGRYARTCASADPKLVLEAEAAVMQTLNDEVLRDLDALAHKEAALEVHMELAAVGLSSVTGGSQSHDGASDNVEQAQPGNDLTEHPGHTAANPPA